MSTAAKFKAFEWMGAKAAVHWYGFREFRALGLRFGFFWGYGVVELLRWVVHAVCFLKLLEKHLGPQGSDSVQLELIAA